MAGPHASPARRLRWTAHPPSPSRRCRRAPHPRWPPVAASPLVAASPPRLAWRRVALLRSRHEAAWRTRLAPPPAAGARPGQGAAQGRGGEGPPSRPPLVAAPAPPRRRHGTQDLWQRRQRGGCIVAATASSNLGRRRFRRQAGRWRQRWGSACRCTGGQGRRRRRRAQWRGSHGRQPTPVATPWRLGLQPLPVSQFRLSHRLQPMQCQDVGWRPRAGHGQGGPFYRWFQRQCPASLCGGGARGSQPCGCTIVSCSACSGTGTRGTRGWPSRCGRTIAELPRRGKERGRNAQRRNGRRPTRSAWGRPARGMGGRTAGGI